MTELQKIESGERYWLGAVVDIHKIGNYALVEYLDRHTKETNFAIYVDGASLGFNADTLDGAIVTAIAVKHDGRNTQAAHFFMRMIGAV